MKKMLTSVLISLVTLTMVFGLTACAGGPSKEKTDKLEGLLNNYDTLVAECEAEFAKYPEADDETYNASLAQVSEMLTQIKALAVDTRKIYNEKKSTYTDENMDELIATLNTQIEKCETFKQEIIKGVQSVNEMLAQ